MSEKCEIGLNKALVVILWLSIVFTGFGIVGYFLDSSLSIIPVALRFVEVFLALGSVVGAFMILKLRKEGFFIFVAVRLLLIVVTIFELKSIPEEEYVFLLGQDRFDALVSDVLKQSFFINLGQIVFLCCLMFTTKNGYNAWEVLWNHPVVDDDEEE